MELREPDSIEEALRGEEEDAEGDLQGANAVRGCKMRVDNAGAPSGTTLCSTF